ncbi:MAG: hypothetical protein IKH57_20715 [Clostridia bacterium]|nr:hypothetical protein [Clostridia bacterium]
MLFQGRFEKALNRLREKQQGRERAFDDENVADKLEKNDTLALILSALLVFLPAALLVLGLVSLIGYLFVVR